MECNNNRNNAHPLGERLRSGSGNMLRLSGVPRTCPVCVLSPLYRQISYAYNKLLAIIYSCTFALGDFLRLRCD